MSEARTLVKELKDLDEKYNTVMKAKHAMDAEIAEEIMKLRAKKNLKS